MIAFLVPRWRRLRHGDPEGRAKLDRAARVLALALAGLQGFGAAQSLRALGSGTSLVPADSDLSISLPVVTFSLVGGVCLQFLAARFLTQRGLANGFAVLLGAGLLGGLVDQLGRIIGLRTSATGWPFCLTQAPHAATPRQLALTVVALGIASLATWVVLGRPSAAPSPVPGDESGGAPYRDARQLVVHPWIPTPASSLQANVCATALLMIPQTLKGLLHVEIPGLNGLLESDVAFLTLDVGLTALVMVVLASLMHRPAEMADLILRVGAKARGRVDEETRGALKLALVPTFLFLLVIILAPNASRLGVLLVPTIIAVAIDVARSIKIELACPGMVRVWEERRASAVPVLRAALAADGIPSEARGMAILSLWQVFAPYAPAEILVKAEDAERATKTLRHWSLGEPAPERAEALPGQTVAATPPKQPWSVARRTLVLGGCVVATVAAIVVARMPVAADVAAGPPAKLEVLRVDDTVDPLATLPDAAIPYGEGIELVWENAPVGPGKSERVHFARMTVRPGELKPSAIGRFRTWLATVPLPADTRFGIEEVTDYDPDTKVATLSALRTFVLRGESALTTGDVTDADAAISSLNEPPDVAVAVTLSPEGGQRFEDLTRAWTQRRAAILVDDEVVSAPVIKTTISGGRISLTMGAGDTEERLVDARRLAARLRRR